MSAFLLVLSHFSDECVQWINGPVDPGSNDGFHIVNQGFQKDAEVPLYDIYDRNSSELLGERGVQPYSDEKIALRANYI